MLPALRAADVALFVLRAVHGLDVLTGASKEQRTSATAAAAASPPQPVAGPQPQATRPGAADSQGGHLGVGCHLTAAPCPAALMAGRALRQQGGK
jgi:hypothetical protein